MWGSITTHRLQAGRRVAAVPAVHRRRVSGVFFAPLELAAEKDDVNARIARALDEAGIPVVLLDRTVVPYPRRGHHDLVGIDNRRAGYVITEHLLRARRAADRVRRPAQRRGDRRRARGRLPRGALRRRSAGGAGAGAAHRSRGRRGCQAADGVAPARRHRLRQRSHRRPADAHAARARLSRAGDVRLVGIDDADFASCCRCR